MKKQSPPDADPPPPVVLTDQIRGMGPNSTLYFENPPHSVRAIVSRVKMEIRGSDFTTRREKKGTRVWRLK